MISLSDHTLWPEITDREREAVARVLDRGVLSGPHAPEASALAAEFAALVGAKHALMTHSGTSAIVLALMAAGVGEGDEVLVPAYSFIATAMAVLSVGGIPIFVDVDPITGLMSPQDAATWITARTKAIMPVHVHGCPVDMTAFRALASKHDVLLLEDAAQAHLATFGNEPAGAMGVAGAFSLQSSKNFSCGEGGLFVTNDARAFEIADQVRNFGQDLRAADRAAYDVTRPLDGSRAMDVVRMGSMMRGNEMAAAFARAQLERLPALTARCQANAARLSARLAALPGVVPPHVPEGRTSVHHKFRVRIEAETFGIEPEGRAAFCAQFAKALQVEGVLVAYWERRAQGAFALFQEREGFGRGWPWTHGDAEMLRDNYRADRFPNVSDLLDHSFLLFSQSRPLIAQEEALVDRYADAFESVYVKSVAS